MTSERRFLAGPWLIAGLFIILAGIAVAGCLIPGLDGFGIVSACEKGASSAAPGADEPGNGEGEPNTVYVNIRNFRFHPGDLEITTGTRVVFVNEDTMEHNVVQTSTRRVGAEPPLFESPILAQGDRWSFVFRQAGEYPIICTVDAHQLMGMVGRIVVVDGDD